MESEILTKQELRRYNRHIILPEIGADGQEKIKSSSVLVVGAGGLGAPVLQYLNAAGTGKIGVIDMDLVSENNLQRQVLYGDNDIGKLKSIISRDRLMSQNSLTDIQIINIKLTKENILTIIPEYDFIIDATDNFETRFLINDACILTGKPWVFGSIYKFEGQVSVFNFNNGPSLRCIFPHQPKKDEAPDPKKLGVLGVLPGLIGMMQANEAIKLMTGYGDLLSGKMLIYNILNNHSKIIRFSKNEKKFNISEIGHYEEIE